MKEEFFKTYETLHNFLICIWLPKHDIFDVVCILAKSCRQTHKKRCIIRRGASWRCNIRSSENKKLMQQCLERSGLANFFFFCPDFFWIDDNFLLSRLSMTECCLNGRNTLHRRSSSSASSLGGIDRYLLSQVVYICVHRFSCWISQTEWKLHGQ